MRSRNTANLERDIISLLDYLWDDESRHYEENPKRNHIFLTMRRLAREVGYAKKP